MLAHAREAVSLVENRTRADLETDRVLELAVVRLLEIVGEAASRVGPEARAEIEIPWPAIVGLRNRLIHGYHDVDLDIVWRILREDLPELVQKLERLGIGDSKA